MLYGVSGEYGRYVESRFDAIHVGRYARTFCDGGDGNGIVVKNRQSSSTALAVAGENFNKIHWDNDYNAFADYWRIGDNLNAFVGSAGIWKPSLSGIATLFYGLVCFKNK